GRDRGRASAGCVALTDTAPLAAGGWARPADPGAAAAQLQRLLFGGALFDFQGDYQNYMFVRYSISNRGLDAEISCLYRATDLDRVCHLELSVLARRLPGDPEAIEVCDETETRSEVLRIRRARRRRRCPRMLRFRGFRATSNQRHTDRNDETATKHRLH